LPSLSGFNIQILGLVSADPSAVSGHAALWYSLIKPPRKSRSANDGVAAGGRRGRGIGWSLGQGPMWAVAVEVAGVDLQDGLQVALGEDQ
jgi:hypothetical protein